MTFNQTGKGEIVGITRQGVAQRLQNLENIRLREFLIICELIDEEPETFYSEGEPDNG